MIKKSNISVFFLACFFASYVLLPLFFSPSKLGVIKSVCITCLCCALYCCNKRGNGVKSVVTIVVPIFICFCLAQLLFFSSAAILKVLFCVCVFAFLTQYATETICEKFSSFMKISSAVIALIVLSFCVKYGHLYYYRSLIFIEKTTISLIFSLVVPLCLIDFCLKRKMGDLFLLMLTLFVNIFVVQSKTAIFVLFLNLGILYFLYKPFKILIRKYKLLLLAICLGAMGCFPSAVLPDDLRFGINRIVGEEVFTSSYGRSVNRMDMTYSIRNDMHKFGFEIFSEHPLMGIGVGEFKNFNRASNSQVSFLSQPESTWLGILIEGGVAYLLCMMMFFLNNLSQSVLKYKENKMNDMALKCAFVNMNFMIIFFFNDFLDLMFWFSMAFFLAGTYIKGKNIGGISRA